MGIHSSLFGRQNVTKSHKAKPLLTGGRFRIIEGLDTSNKWTCLVPITSRSLKLRFIYIFAHPAHWFIAKGGPKTVFSSHGNDPITGLPVNISDIVTVIIILVLAIIDILYVIMLGHHDRQSSTPSLVLVLFRMRLLSSILIAALHGTLRGCGWDGGGASIPRLVCWCGGNTINKRLFANKTPCAALCILARNR